MEMVDIAQVVDVFVLHLNKKNGLVMLLEIGEMGI
jgi:hypothetical protein